MSTLLSDSTIHQFAEQCRLDETALWEIEQAVIHDLNIHDRTLIRSTVIDAARRLLRQKDILAVEYNVKKYQVLATDPDKAIEIIENLWDKADSPAIGSIIYFIDKKYFEKKIQQDDESRT